MSDYKIKLRELQEAINPTVTCSGSHGKEDEILRALFPNDPVVYVDVGAANPEECNNTWQFYQAGGHGLLIEPVPKYQHALLRHRPRDSMCPIAASNCCGIGELRISKEGGGSASSLEETWDIQETDRIPVEKATLASVLENYPDIRDACQFCDIDVEGHEREVLLGIDWDTFRPAVFCIEHIKFHRDHTGPDISNAWADILLDHNYMEAIRTSVGNIIYVHQNYRGNWDCAKENLEL